MSYDAFETSATQGNPVELYEFIYGPNYLRYTSAADPITVGAVTYVPAALQRSEFQNRSGSFEDTLTITGPGSFPPADFFRVRAPSVVMALNIYRRHVSDTATNYIVQWVGRVLGAAWKEGNQVELSCETALSSLRRIALRRFYQRGCAWPLYGVGCRLNPAAFGTTTSVFAVSGTTLSVSAVAAAEDNYYAGGYVEWMNSVSGIKDSLAIRSSQAGDLHLVDIPYGIANASEVSVYPGCDHTFATCNTKFNNHLNYGGQPSIPEINPMGGATLF